MATTYTPNLKLGSPAVNDRTWNAALDANRAILDALAPIGGLAVSLAEVPSASLNVRVAPGTFRQAAGTTFTYAGAATQAVTASASTYLWLADDGTLATGAAWPSGVPFVRLAVVTAGAATVAAIADARVAFGSAGVATAACLPLAGGTMASAAVIASAGSGLTVAGTPAQLLGFWGATPAARPSGASQAAFGTTATTTATLTTVGATNTSDVSGTINSNEAAINAQLGNAAADIAALATLVNAIRSALVGAGLMKGSA